MADAGTTIRLDIFLWYARLAKTRSIAQEMAEAGTLRLDGRRIERSAAPVRVGSVIAFPQRGQVRVLRVERLPKRRGPASEATTLYQLLLTPSGSSSASYPISSDKPDNVSQKAGLD